jgi:hypothetical protein
MTRTEDIRSRAQSLGEMLDAHPAEKLRLLDSLRDAMSYTEYWALADPELVDCETRLAKIVEAIERHHLLRADIIQRVFGGLWPCTT